MKPRERSRRWQRHRCWGAKANIGSPCIHHQPLFAVLLFHGENSGNGHAFKSEHDDPTLNGILGELRIFFCYFRSPASIKATRVLAAAKFSAASSIGSTISLTFLRTSSSPEGPKMPRMLWCRSPLKQTQQDFIEANCRGALLKIIQPAHDCGKNMLVLAGGTVFAHTSSTSANPPMRRNPQQLKKRRLPVTKIATLYQIIKALACGSGQNTD